MPSVFLLMITHLSAYLTLGNGMRYIFPVSRSKSAFQHINLHKTHGSRNAGTIRLFLSEKSHLHTKTASDSDANLAEEPEPFTWQRLVELFRHPDRNNHFVPSNHRKLELFRRSSSVQSTYLKHQSKLKREWKSAYDYLCVNKFGKEFGFISVPIDAQDGASQLEASPSLKDASAYAIKNRLRYLSLVANDFPYDVCSEINHYCLWKIGGTSTSEGILQDEIKWAITELTKSSNFVGSTLILNGYEVEHYATKHECSNDDHGITDYLYWVNPPHLQSMPEILHAHILVLRGDDGNEINLGNLDNSLSTFRSKL